jgi:hypothetical protein
MAEQATGWGGGRLRGHLVTAGVLSRAGDRHLQPDGLG